MLTIPIGQIGNDRPIEVTTERWESLQLKALIMSRQSDPRTGEIEFRLIDIGPGEPAATLFTVPEAMNSARRRALEPERLIRPRAVRRGNSDLVQAQVDAQLRAVVDDVLLLSRGWLGGRPGGLGSE